MATPAEKAAYRQRLRQIVIDADRADRRSVTAIRRLTRAVQREILSKLAALHAQSNAAGNPPWGAWYLPRMQASVIDAFHEASQQLGLEMSSSILPAASARGLALADAPCVALGVDLARLDPSMILTTSRYSADLVSGYGESGIRQITSEIQVSVLSGEPVTDLMTRLGSKIDTRGTPFHDVRYRAEVIARTETRRVQDLARQRRSYEVAQVYPEIGLAQLYVTAEVGNYPCSVCEEYDGAVYRLDGTPIDLRNAPEGEAPELPQHPNCRCVYVPYVPDLTTRPGPGERSENVTLEPEEPEEPDEPEESQ